jgi:putative nucleotidyltransferase with HDIG domain
VNREALKRIELPALPEVAHRVLVALGNENVSLGEIESLASKDFVLSTRLLKLANSVFFSRSGRISTVSSALLTVGFNVAKSLLIALSMKDLCRTRIPFERDLWEHQLGVSLYAFFIATEVRLPMREEALVTGLVHDIGKAVLNKSMPEEYGRVIERVRRDDIPFVDAEQEMLSFTHCEVGGLVLDHWKLPGEMREAVERHHASPATERLRTDKLGAILSLADAICWAEGIGFSSDTERKGMTLHSFVGLSAQALSRLRVEVKEIYQSQRDLLLSI